MNRSNQDFAEKLYLILEDPKNINIIRWSDDGETFIILDTIEFARKILELYFKHKNLNSFVRQLNKYDFHKMKSSDETLERYGNHIWEFKHANFQRKRRELLGKIVRKKSLNERKNEYGELSNDVAEKKHNASNTDAFAFKNSFITLSDDLRRYYGPKKVYYEWREKKCRLSKG